jgi:hypothetical protein
MAPGAGQRQSADHAAAVTARGGARIVLLQQLFETSLARDNH